MNDRDKYEACRAMKMKTLAASIVAWALIISSLCAVASAEIVVGSFGFAGRDDIRPSNWVAHYDPRTTEVTKVDLNWEFGSNRGFCMYQGGGTYNPATGDMDITFVGQSGPVAPCTHPDNHDPEWPTNSLRVIRRGDEFTGILEQYNSPKNIHYSFDTIYENPDTSPGDGNADGVFGSADLVAAFAAGGYEGSPQWDYTWQQGDWDLSGSFDSGDLVYAFGEGRYETGAAAVPEPSAVVLVVLGSLLFWRGR